MSLEKSNRILIEAYVGAMWQEVYHRMLRPVEVPSDKLVLDSFIEAFEHYDICTKDEIDKAFLPYNEGELRKMPKAEKVAYSYHFKKSGGGDARSEEQLDQKHETSWEALRREAKNGYRKEVLALVFEAFGSPKAFSFGSTPHKKLRETEKRELRQFQLISQIRRDGLTDKLRDDLESLVVEGCGFKQINADDTERMTTEEYLRRLREINDKYGVTTVGTR